MAELKRPNPEIIPGAKVVINQRLGVSESEANSLLNIGGIKEVRKVNAKSLQAWNDAGLKIGSEGIITAVYITGYSNVLFNPTEKVFSPFLYAVPTICLSIK